MSDQPAPRWRTVDGISLPTQGVYDVDPRHTFAMFRVRHLVVGRVDGRFTSSTASSRSSRMTRGCSVVVTIEPASVDTHVQMRDDDLRSPRFLDTDHFPAIVLTGGTSSRVADDPRASDAELTIRAVTRPIVLRVSFRGMAIEARIARTPQLGRLPRRRSQPLSRGSRARQGSRRHVRDGRGIRRAEVFRDQPLASQRDSPGAAASRSEFRQRTPDSHLSGREINRSSPQPWIGLTRGGRS
jgi:polyisoprenoid-binding protein YceI